MPATTPPAARIEKREAAQARQAAYDALSPQDRIARLDKRLGKGKGARKERRKLAA